MNCPLCGCHGLVLIYRVEDIPVFQNKVYESESLAQEAVVGDVELSRCIGCGFVFNRLFEASLMDYDDNYQNEQSHSTGFDNYLDSIVKVFERKGFGDSKVVEIGCGKGAFLSKLWARGFDAQGYDPAYEGGDGRVTKDYFSAKYAGSNVGLIVLRHTLEHVASPFEFIREIAEFCNYEGSIYIEVPCFDWILDKGAWWDVFYEHCNYFTANSLQSMFYESEVGHFFSGQYLYLFAELKSVRKSVKEAASVKKDIVPAFSIGEGMRAFAEDHKGMVVWGAGAKGSTYVNTVDPDRSYISAVVDINPKKVGCYVAKSGHQIVSPDDLDKSAEIDILVMNGNYEEEIKASLIGRPYNFFVLDES